MRCRIKGSGGHIYEMGWRGRGIYRPNRYDWGEEEEGGVAMR